MRVSRGIADRWQSDTYVDSDKSVRADSNQHVLMAVIVSKWVEHNIIYSIPRSRWRIRERILAYYWKRTPKNTCWAKFNSCMFLEVSQTRWLDGALPSSKLSQRWSRLVSRNIVHRVVVSGKVCVRDFLHSLLHASVMQGASQGEVLAMSIIFPHNMYGVRKGAKFHPIFHEHIEK